MNLYNYILIKYIIVVVNENKSLYIQYLKINLQTFLDI